MITRVIMVMTCFFLSNSVLSKEIVLGVELVPQKKWALNITPFIPTEPISLKLALEYRMHPHINLIVPLEGKWMDYAWAIRGLSKLFGAKENYPEEFYNPKKAVKLGWNVNYSRWHVSSGLGMKYIPFSESMQDGFYIKIQQLIGIERFNAFSAEGIKISALLNSALSFGYTWVAGNVFSYGFEGGVQWIYHLNPIDKLPNPFWGFEPIAQASFGFTF